MRYPRPVGLYDGRCPDLVPDGAETNGDGLDVERFKSFGRELDVTFFFRVLMAFFTVLAGAFSVAELSGAAFNPAVAIGVVTMGLVSPAMLWIYAVAELAGAVVAALLFKSLNPDDK